MGISRGCWSGLEGVTQGGQTDPVMTPETTETINQGRELTPRDWSISTTPPPLQHRHYHVVGLPRTGTHMMEDALLEKGACVTRVTLGVEEFNLPVDGHPIIFMTRDHREQVLSILLARATHCWTVPTALPPRPLVFEPDHVAEVMRQIAWAQRTWERMLHPYEGRVIPVDYSKVVGRGTTGGRRLPLIDGVVLPKQRSMRRGQPKVPMDRGSFLALRGMRLPVGMFFVPA